MEDSSDGFAGTGDFYILSEASHFHNVPAMRGERGEVVGERGEFVGGADGVGEDKGFAEDFEELDVKGGGGSDGLGRSGGGASVSRGIDALLSGYGRGASAVVGDEASEGGGDGLGKVGMFRVVGADVVIHLIRGEGDVEIVGDEGGFFIRQVEVRYTPRHHFSIHGVYTPCATTHADSLPHGVYTPYKNPPALRGAGRVGWGEGVG